MCEIIKQLLVANKSIIFMDEIAEYLYNISYSGIDARLVDSTLPLFVCHFLTKFKNKAENQVYRFIHAYLQVWDEFFISHCIRLNLIGRILDKFHTVRDPNLLYMLTDILQYLLYEVQWIPWRHREPLEDRWFTEVICWANKDKYFSSECFSMLIKLSKINKDLWLWFKGEQFIQTIVSVWRTGEQNFIQLTCEVLPICLQNTENSLDKILLESLLESCYRMLNKEKITVKADSMIYLTELLKNVEERILRNMILVPNLIYLFESDDSTNELFITNLVAFYSKVLQKLGKYHPKMLNSLKIEEIAKYIVESLDLK